MRFLIIGYGSIGRRHLRNLITLGEQDIVLLRSHKSTLDTDEIRDFPVETDLKSALVHKPDAVIVANPTSLHLDSAIPAARAGCHLFFEKPVSHSLERIPELYEALESGGGKAFVGFQFRFHPGLKKVRDLVFSETLGKVISARAHWGEYLPGWHPWEDHRKSYSARKDLGGGVIRTLSHPLDYMRWLFGDVESLWSYYKTVSALEIETEAVAEIAMQFYSGVIGAVHLNYIQRPARHDLEVVLDGGTIRWDNSDGSVRWYEAGTETWQRQELPVGFDRNDLFLAEMRNFIEYISGREEAVCTLADGISAQHLVQAALQANKYSEMVKL